jgi:hypothetical protein
VSARPIRKAAGLSEVRFHDGRHTAITTLAEKGMPDWVIQAQVGHVAPEMMKTYSHIRREALNQAAAALEPTKPISSPVTPPPKAQQPAVTGSESATTVVSDTSPAGVSHVAPPATSLRGRVIDFPKKRIG